MLKRKKVLQHMLKNNLHIQILHGVRSAFNTTGLAWSG